MNSTPPSGPVPSRHTHTTQQPHTRSIRIYYPEYGVPKWSRKKHIKNKK